MVADKPPIAEYRNILNNIFQSADLLVGYNNIGFDDAFIENADISLPEDAKEYALDEWGILAYYRKEDGSGEIKCIKKAEKLDAPMREFALVEAIRRRLK